ncbi:hypothetical protein KAU11_08480 [Candidatus Babeliales bacterium]|nr:hypothetical protein [Candidatus Babeliales bacterium]
MNDIVTDIIAIEVYDLVIKGKIDLPDLKNEVLPDFASVLIYNSIINKIAQNMVSKYSNSYAQELTYLAKYVSYGLTHYGISSMLTKKGSFQASFIKILMSVGIKDILMTQF